MEDKVLIGKVHPCTGLEGSDWELMYSSILSLPSALNGVGWSAPRLGRCTAGRETQYPLYRALGGPQGRSGRVWKISPPTGIRSPDRGESAPIELSRPMELCIQSNSEQKRLVSGNARAGKDKCRTGQLLSRGGLTC